MSNRRDIAVACIPFGGVAIITASMPDIHAARTAFVLLIAQIILGAMGIYIIWPKDNGNRPPE